MFCLPKEGVHRVQARSPAEGVPGEFKVFQKQRAQGAGSVCTQGAGAQDVGQESKSFQRRVQVRSLAGVCLEFKAFQKQRAQGAGVPHTPSGA